VRITIEISDALLARAKKQARKLGKPLRALIEEGLRRVLEDAAKRPAYELRDRSIGRAGGPSPLETWSWRDLRDAIYGGR
jgi:hypothetical protein